MTGTNSIPLYTRSSDRSIGDCPAQWHIANQGIEENTASWFELGTALHYTIEQAILEELTLRRAQNRAWKNVKARIKEYEDIAPMLWSPNRPKEELEEISKRLITSWWNDWMAPEATTDLGRPVTWPPQLEVFITIPPDLMPTGLAGMRTQVDAMFKCRQCKGQVLVDWKTGRTRRSDPTQLQIYRYGLELLGERFCKCNPAFGFFYHLEHEKLQPVEEYDADEVIWVITDSQRTKKETPIQAIPSWKCDWCVGRSVCPAWQEDDADAEAARGLIELNRQGYHWVSDPTTMVVPSKQGEENGT